MYDLRSPEEIFNKGFTSNNAPEPCQIPELRGPRTGILLRCLEQKRLRPHLQNNFNEHTKGFETDLPEQGLRPVNPMHIELRRLPRISEIRRIGTPQSFTGVGSKGASNIL
jgi:hypothetical protein